MAQAQALGLISRAREAEDLLTIVEQVFEDERDIAAATALRIGTIWGPLNRPGLVNGCRQLRRRQPACRPVHRPC